MSLLKRTTGFYRPPFNRPATHYPVHPENLAAWLASGKVGSAIAHGRYYRKAEMVAMGRTDQLKHTPHYRMPTADFLALEIARDHTLELIDPDTEELVALRVANWEHTNGGHTLIRLQGASPE